MSFEIWTKIKQIDVNINSHFYKNFHLLRANNTASIWINQQFFFSLVMNKRNKNKKKRLLDKLNYEIERFYFIISASNGNCLQHTVSSEVEMKKSTTQSNELDQTFWDNLSLGVKDFVIVDARWYSATEPITNFKTNKKLNVEIGVWTWCNNTGTGIIICTCLNLYPKFNILLASCKVCINFI